MSESVSKFLLCQIYRGPFRGEHVLELCSVAVNTSIR